MPGVRTFALGAAACIGCGKVVRAPFGVLGVIECGECQAAMRVAAARRRAGGVSVSGIFARESGACGRISAGRRVHGIVGRKNG